MTSFPAEARLTGVARDGPARAVPQPPVVFALLLLAAVAGLCWLDRDLYLSVMRAWMVHPMPNPFADTAFITAQLECWRTGVDVYVTNPCDPFGRIMVYSPLWLRLWFLPGGQAATVPLGFSLILGFIFSLGVLPRVRGKAGMFALLLAIASPATVFAAERGNVDLLVFALAAVAILCADRASPARLTAYAPILAAALLKFYPFAMFALIVRERPRVATVLEMGTLAVTAAFIWIWHGELALALRNIPRPEYGFDAVGGRRLAEALVVLAARISGLVHAGHGWPIYDFHARPLAIMATFAALLGAAGAAAWTLTRGQRPENAFRALNTRETLCLVIGAALFCGCFALGASYDYREIVLLFAIPALARFSRDKALAWPMRWALWATVALMWNAVSIDRANQAFGAMDGDKWPVPTFIVWLAGEGLAWWVFTILLAALLLFARSSRATLRAENASPAA
jgi:hypothetical protein